MGMAKRSMPESLEDEFDEWQERMMWQEYERPVSSDDGEAMREWQWSYDEDRQRLDPHADPKCPYCHGTGTVYDLVDYGSTTVQMPSACECVEVDEDGD